MSAWSKILWASLLKAALPGALSLLGGARAAKGMQREVRMKQYTA